MGRWGKLLVAAGVNIINDICHVVFSVVINRLWRRFTAKKGEKSIL